MKASSTVVPAAGAVLAAPSEGDPDLARPGRARRGALARLSPVLVSCCALLAGCKTEVLDPQGKVGQSEVDLIVLSFLLMLLVVIPVIFMTLVFAWRFRASNTSVEHRPNWSHSTRIEVFVWGVPCLIILALSVITWESTHALDPYKRIASKQPEMVIDVVALDWKWLFIYPEQHIATINQIAIPVGTPVDFRITSDAVMNSFFIPQLGSQIYAMAGMETQDHLIADHPGVFQGRSAQFSGRGFSDMKFDVLATDQAGFDAWVAKVRSAGTTLQASDYDKVLAPSEKVPATYFSSVDPRLFQGIIAKYQGKAMNMHSSMEE